jgi:hypothetical protein
MFDKGAETLPDMHRIYVEFEGGYFVTSLHNPQFHQQLQEMVLNLGRPVKVEFRATDEGWYQDDGDNGDEGGLL